MDDNQNLQESPFADNESPEMEEDILEQENQEAFEEEPFEEEEEEEELDTDDEVPEEDEEEQVQTVPHAALHKERERRKEAQQSLALAQQETAEASSKVQEYEAALDAIEMQIKELGLEDVVTLDKPRELDPEAKAYREQQQQAQQQEAVHKTVGEIREEAANLLPEYPMIDGDSSVHEEIVLGLSIAAMYFGADAESAAESAMKTLNSTLTSSRKGAVRKQVQVKKQPTASRSVRRRAGKKATVSAGNTKAFFDSMAEDAFK